MCNVAVAIYTAPPHADTRVASARKSWTKRICPYGKYLHSIIEKKSIEKKKHNNIKKNKIE